MNTNDIFSKLMDKQTRQQLRDNPQLAGELFGYDASFSDITFVVKTNTKAVTYICIPPSQEENLELHNIQAAGTSTTSSLGSTSTAGSACSTISTAGSAGSLGSLNGR